VAVTIASSSAGPAFGSDIWIGGLERGDLTRLTSKGGNSLPLWTREGRRVTFSSKWAGRNTSASKLLRRHRNDLLASKLERPRSPVRAWRTPNGIGGGKGKGTSGSSARPKVPIPRSGRDCLVIAWKRGNARVAKGAGHWRQDRWVNRQGEEPTGGGGGRQPSLDGTSRVRGDCHARF
jgi:hypothetical protein